MTSSRSRSRYFESTIVDGSISASFLDANTTNFNELRVAQNHIQFNIKPTWGISEFRDKTQITGTLANITSSLGEIQLSTGTSSSGSVILRTLRRGNYEPGTTIIAGCGIRIPTLPIENQRAYWGYFGPFNGFGWGIDSTGSFTFLRKRGSDTIYRSSEWLDILNGSGSSGIDLDVTKGYIYHIEFLWYGYGDVKWEVFAGGGLFNDLILADNKRITGSISIEDPNQPLSVEIHNSGTLSNFDCFVGGRGIYRIGNPLETSFTRHFHHMTSSYVVTSPQNVWEPILQIRKKPSFRGLQENSVNCHFHDVAIDTNQSIEYKVTFKDNNSTAIFVDTEEMGNESAMEINQGAFSSSAGYPYVRGIISANKQSERSESSVLQDIFVMPDDELITLWIKKIDNLTTTIQANLTWVEEW